MRVSAFIPWHIPVAFRSPVSSRPVLGEGDFASGFVISQLREQSSRASEGAREAVAAKVGEWWHMRKMVRNIIASPPSPSSIFHQYIRFTHQPRKPVQPEADAFKNRGITRIKKVGSLLASSAGAAAAVTSGCARKHWAHRPPAR